MPASVTMSVLKYQIIDINILLGVEEGDVGYCYLSLIRPTGKPYLYQVKQIINETGASQDFLGTDHIRSNILSKMIDTFLQGFKLALSKVSPEGEIDNTFQYTTTENLETQHTVNQTMLNSCTVKKDTNKLLEHSRIHSLRNYLDAKLKALPKYHRKILLHRLGLFGYERKTLKEIGETMGLTRERIRQIQVKGMNELRKVIEAHGIILDTLFDEVKIPVIKQDIALILLMLIIFVLNDNHRPLLQANPTINYCNLKSQRR